MARPLRIEYPGALYHVTSRGNGRRRIFRTDKDKDYFLELLWSLTERFHFLCHAYCLMDNHYHLVMETPEGNLSRGMRQLNGIYTQKFNGKYKTTGHIFQGRYKAILVQKDPYLLALCRYVVLNPVRAGMVRKPEEWKWSSFRATAGLTQAPSFLTTGWVLGQFSTDRKRAQRLFRTFAKGKDEKDSPWKELKGQIFLGDTRFIERIKTSPSPLPREVPRSQRYAGRPELAELFAPEISQDKTTRDTRIFTAHVTFGYTLKEIADHLSLNYSTVSRAVKRVSEKKHESKT